MKTQMLRPLNFLVPTPFAVELNERKCQPKLDRMKTQRIGEWKTFFHKPQVVCLGLHDSFQSLNIASKFFDLGFVELGGRFGVL